MPHKLSVHFKKAETMKDNPVTVIIIGFARVLLWLMFEYTEYSWQQEISIPLLWKNQKYGSIVHGNGEEMLNAGGISI